MNGLDILLVIPAIWAGFRGFCNGLVKEIFSVLAFGGGIWCAFKFSDLLAEKIDTPMASTLAFIIIFVAVIVITFLVGRGIDRVVKVAVPDFVDRLCGICFGILKVAMISSILLICIQKIDTKQVILKSDTVQESLLYPYVDKTTIFLKEHKDALSSERTPASRFIQE